MRFFLPYLLILLLLASLGASALLTMREWRRQSAVKKLAPLVKVTPAPRTPPKVRGALPIPTVIQPGKAIAIPNCRPKVTDNGHVAPLRYVASSIRAVRVKPR